jgi:hypothetical protein
LFHELRKKGDCEKDTKKGSLKQVILDDMQNRAEKDVLELYKNADRIKRNQMWIRFPACRKAFDEIDVATCNKWQLSRVVGSTNWYKKKISI